MVTFKKVWHFITSILFFTIIAIAVIAALMFIATFIDKKTKMAKGNYTSPLFGAYVIISNSMVPSINVYDAVLTVRTNTDNIKNYDIITFISKNIETKGTPITHRVIDIVHDQENPDKIIGYRTKGDHNNSADFALIAPEEVLGKVFLRIPLIGYLQLFLSKPIGWLFVIVIPCLLIIGNDILKYAKSNKNNTSQDIETINDITNNISNTTVNSSIYENSNISSQTNIENTNINNQSNIVNNINNNIEEESNSNQDII